MSYDYDPGYAFTYFMSWRREKMREGMFSKMK
ncbi:hypothetical protein OKW46_003243 [Paraburkholderia sp. WSM4179]|nr:hypothetical protein [Paraburkholderia sp. WSM4179]